MNSLSLSLLVLAAFVVSSISALPQRERNGPIAEAQVQEVRDPEERRRIFVEKFGFGRILPKPAPGDGNNNRRRNDKRKPEPRIDVVEESPEVHPPPPLARSVLYESLGLLPSNRLVEEVDTSDYPEEGDIIQDVVIEVESPVLKVNRVPNPRKKLRERAEARRADRQ